MAEISHEYWFYPNRDDLSLEVFAALKPFLSTHCDPDYQKKFLRIIDLTTNEDLRHDDPIYIDLVDRYGYEFSINRLTRTIAEFVSNLPHSLMCSTVTDPCMASQPVAYSLAADIIDDLWQFLIDATVNGSTKKISALIAVPTDTTIDELAKLLTPIFSKHCVHRVISKSPDIANGKECTADLNGIAPVNEPKCDVEVSSDAPIDIKTSKMHMKGMVTDPDPKTPKKRATKSRKTD